MTWPACCSAPLRLIAKARSADSCRSASPLCAEHDPRGDSSVHLAACHVCQFASETSCEHGNRFDTRAHACTWGAARRRSSPVWTGPHATGEQRLTAGVLHELIANASDRVLLVSFAAYTLREVADDLESAVGRGCAADVVFETAVDSAGAYDGPRSAPFGQLAGTNRWRWPSDRRSEGAALHAKLLVVDGRRALVGSANLTNRALTANLEAGVLIRDVDVAGSIEAHVRGLMSAGVPTRAS